MSLLKASSPNTVTTLGVWASTCGLREKGTHIQSITITFTGIPWDFFCFVLLVRLFFKTGSQVIQAGLELSM